MTQLTHVLEMTRTLLELADKADWHSFERVLLKRENEIEKVFSTLDLNAVSPQAAKDIHTLRELNDTLLTRAKPEAKRVQAEIARLQKNSKANSVYKRMR